MSGDKIPPIDPKTGQFVRPSKGERIIQLIGLLEGEYLIFRKKVKKHLTN